MTATCFYPLTPALAATLREHLTAAEWRLWSFFATFIPFGERPVRLPETDEILRECDLGESTYYRALAKFEALGLFEVRDRGLRLLNCQGARKVLNASAGDSEPAPTEPAPVEAGSTEGTQASQPSEATPSSGSGLPAVGVDSQQWEWRSPEVPAAANPTSPQKRSESNRSHPPAHARARTRARGNPFRRKERSSLARSQPNHSGSTAQSPPSGQNNYPASDQSSASAAEAAEPEPTPLGYGPWQSRAEMERFQRDLEAYGRASGKRSPSGWANTVMDRLRRGERVTYWEEWTNGEPIGECERQPWESAPGQPRSAFVEYLTEHLGYAHETEAQARERAHWVLAQPQRAASHWEAFKHYCQREAERQQQQRDRGVQATDVPRCFKAAYERTSEQVAQESAATLIEHAQASGTLPDSAPAGDALPAQPEPEADPSEGTTTREATEQRDRASDSGLEEPLADTTQRAIDKGVLEGSGLRAAARGLWLRAFRLHWDPQAEHSDRLRAWQLLLDYDATAEWAREHWPEDLPLE